MSHCIRLRAGWIRQTGSLQTKVGLPDPLSDRVPDRVTEGRRVAAHSGLLQPTVVYRRPFNCPSGLAAGEVDRVPVDLVVESWTGTLVARLDDVILSGPLSPSEAPLRVSLSDRLRGHHALTIELTPADGPLAEPQCRLTGPECRLTGIVYLEIHDEATSAPSGTVG